MTSLDPQTAQALSSLVTGLYRQSQDQPSLWSQLGPILSSPDPKSALRSQLTSHLLQQGYQALGLGLDPSWRSFAQQYDLPYHQLYPLQQMNIDPTRFSTLWATNPTSAQGLLQSTQRQPSFWESLMRMFGMGGGAGAAAGSGASGAAWGAAEGATSGGAAAFL